MKNNRLLSGRHFQGNKRNGTFYVTLCLQTEGEFLTEEKIKRKVDSMATDGKEEIELETIMDMPEVYRDQGIPSRVLLMGGPGTGKTTISETLSYRWGIRELWDDKYDFVFHLTCRKLKEYCKSDSKETNILKLLLEHHPPGKKNNISEELYQHIKAYPEKVLVIIDGLDELTGWKEFIKQHNEMIQEQMELVAKQKEVARLWSELNEKRKELNKTLNELHKEVAATQKEVAQKQSEVHKTPKEGDKTPKEEDKTPKEEVKTPKEEDKTPKEEVKTLKEEAKTQKAEDKTPKEEVKTLKEEDKTQKEEDKTQKEEDKTQKEEDKTTTEEVKTPKEEDKTQTEEQVNTPRKQAVQKQKQNTEAQKEVDKNQKDVQQKRKELEKKKNKVTEKQNEVTEKQKEVDKKFKEVVRILGELEEKLTKVAEKETEVEKIQKEVDNKKTIKMQNDLDKIQMKLANKQNQLAEKQRDVYENQQALCTNQKEVAQKQEAVFEKERLLFRKQKEVEDKQNELEEDKHVNNTVKEESKKQKKGDEREKEVAIDLKFVGRKQKELSEKQKKLSEKQRKLVEKQRTFVEKYKDIDKKQKEFLKAQNEAHEKQKDFTKKHIKSKMQTKHPVPQLIFNLAFGLTEEKVAVLLTSRPDVSIKKLSFLKALYASGFNKDAIDECSFALCEMNKDMHKELMDLIKNKQPALYYLCVVPLNCVLLWSRLLEDRESIKSLTDMSLTTVIACVHSRDDQANDPYELTPHEVNLLRSMAGLAYESFLSEDLIYANSNLKHHNIDVNDSSVNNLIEIHDSVNEQSADKQASFIHLSIQEFLAAVHVCLTWKEEDVEKVATVDPGSRRLDNVQLYTAGLLGNRGKGHKFLQALDDRHKDQEQLYLNQWKAYVSSMNPPGEVMSSLIRLQMIRCASEGRMPEMIEAVAKAVLKVTYEDPVTGHTMEKVNMLDLSLIDGGLLPHHLVSIGYFIQESGQVGVLR